MFYRLYTLECVDGIYVGVKVADTETDSSVLTVRDALRYYTRQHEKSNIYNKLCAAVSKHGFRGFIIKFDKQVFTNKDDAYVRMGEIQKKVPNLLNDFIMTNEKVRCECGHFIRVQYMEQHKAKYCDMTSSVLLTETNLFD
jgi:hypothetical protein